MLDMSLVGLLIATISRQAGSCVAAPGANSCGLDDSQLLALPPMHCTTSYKCAKSALIAAVNRC